ncbi:C-X-C chemokine receptor type 5 isoform X2 [Denticeps clupeoides]|uniref:G-protein coupled receptors family 1 profile domain-containing protein n=1 Tax=Denticeps clupeoides TaxID=299321 RepID=A0AAY4E4A6_9TELE|nr:C-X-C chemokine receptor type 5 isoform X2 [Denticeps clupeoides]
MIFNQELRGGEDDTHGFEGLDFENYDEANTTISTDGYTCEEEDTNLALFHVAFVPVIYTLVFLLGLAGNSLMLIVLLQRLGHLRVTEIYLLHLALADLLFLFTFPFVVTQVAVGWVFGEFLCKITGLLRCLNLLCGSLLLACISFDRYLAVVHAIPSLHSRQPRIVHLTCVVLWALCLGLSVPDAVFRAVTESNDTNTHLFCFYKGIESNNWILVSRILTHVFGFFLPMVIMSYCYSAVVLTLCRSQRSLEKQGAIRLALLLTVVFCLCWFPFNLARLLSTLVQMGPLSDISCESRIMLKQALSVTECIGDTHCCLNPILYAFIGVRFRNDLLQLLAKWGCICIKAPALRSKNQSRASISEGITLTTSSNFI